MIVDSTNPRIMADNIRELAKNGGGGGSDLPDVTIADNGKILGVVEGSWNKMNAPSGVSHYKVTSGSIEGTYAEVLADLTAGKLVCLDLYANGSLAETFFRDGRFLGEELSSLGFYTISNKIEKAILSSDGSFTISRTYPLAVDYSTSEQNTGRKWIDGKPIYQKTVVKSDNITSGVDNAVLHGIANIDEVIDYDAIMIESSGYSTKMTQPVASASSATSNVNATYAGYVNFVGKTDFLYTLGSVIVNSVSKIVVTIYYTKATTTETKKRKTTKGEN